MKYSGYYTEHPAAPIHRDFHKGDIANTKTEIWNALIDSDLSEITEDDFSIWPRILPLSYWPTLYKSVYEITLFTMRLLSLPEAEIRAIVPRGPIRDHLLDELKVVRYHRGRITGSYRYDMAIVGPADKHHPPQLLEINEIGFDGLARSSFFQRTLLAQYPESAKRLKMLDTAANEITNMRRLGKKIARIQYDNYNWDEEYLLRTAQHMNTDLRLICPQQFGLTVDRESFPQLAELPIRKSHQHLVVGQDFKPDAVNLSFAFGLKDYQEGFPLYQNIVKSETPQYGPFLTGLVAAKTILVLLSDRQLRHRLGIDEKKIAGSLLPAHLLSSEPNPKALKNPRDWVLKHTDGCGGEQVYMNQALVQQLRRIGQSRSHEWVLQKKTKLNLIETNGLLSRPKKAISDLGVFVQYDWANGRFRHFEIGGLMCRATNKSLKVNVSGGGLQVGVLLDKNT